MTALISFDSVSKNYFLGESTIAALDHVDLTISQGEFIAVWGPSGSGKSTLCNIAGLLDAPSGGQVTIRGQNTSELTDNQKSELRSQSIGFIFQGFNLMPVLNAVENVLLPLRIGGQHSSTSANSATDLLSDLGLGDHLQHRPDKLSGGQQQRVAIARALITAPDIVIADEPTANLDTETALRIIGLMRELNQSRQTTFLFSTHDQRLLEQADRKILLTDGRINETGEAV